MQKTRSNVASPKGNSCGLVIGMKRADGKRPRFSSSNSREKSTPVYLEAKSGYVESTLARPQPTSNTASPVLHLVQDPPIAGSDCQAPAVKSISA